MNPVSSYKFIIIGHSGSGKTSILKRLIDNSFVSNGQSTIGVEFEPKNMTVDGKKVKLQIWDTAGQERFKSVSKAYYRGAVGVLLVFDLTEMKTFEDLDTWLVDVHNLCDSNVVIQLIGNKSDLVSKREVSAEKAEAYAEKNKLLYIETSALNGNNIEDAFQRVALAIMKTDAKSPPSRVSKVPLLNREDKSDKSSCNC